MVGVNFFVHFIKTLNESYVFIIIIVCLENKLDLSSETDKYKDFRFVKWFSKNAKLQGIPFSAFYSEKSKFLAEDYLRFCFFKVICNLQYIFGILIKNNFI